MADNLDESKNEVEKVGCVDVNVAGLGIVGREGGLGRSLIKS